MLDPGFAQSLNLPLFIGFAGRTGAGKTVAATYLHSHFGFQYARYSKVLREWISSNLAEPGSLQEIGWKIMAGGLQPELNARLISEIDPLRSAAIDGVRHMIDVTKLTAAFGTSFRLIFLDARPEVRFSRRRQSYRSYEDFQAADMHGVESHIDSLKTRATITIPNEGSQERLYEQLNSSIATFLPGTSR